MLDATYRKDILEALDHLDKEEQRQALAYIRSLRARTGVPGTALLRFAGSIPLDDLKQMAQAIEEDCEKIDNDDW